MAFTRPEKLPRWADGDPDYIQEPTEGQKDTGYGAERPTYKGWNWLLNRIYNWLGYFDQKGPLRIAARNFILKVATGLDTIQVAAQNPANGTIVVFGTVGTDGKAKYSTNGGLSWLDAGLTITGRNIYSAAFGNGKWLVGDGQGKVWVSSNLVNWTETDPGFTAGHAATALCYGNSLYLVGGANGEIATSPDATLGSWTLQTSGVSTVISSLIWESVNELYLAGTVDSILSSPTGVTWTKHAVTPGGSPTGCFLAANADGIVIAAFTTGTIFKSSTGLSWALVYTDPASLIITDAASSEDGLFFVEGTITGLGYFICLSWDAAEWERKSTIAAGSYRGALHSPVFDAWFVPEEGNFWRSLTA